MKEQNFEASTVAQERTIAACAWLIDIAQYSVDHLGWSSDIVKFLDALGSGTHAALNGGMGAVAPMKRSVTGVEVCAHFDVCRGTSRLNGEACAACHAKQDSVGAELMQ